jgi:putative ABC transport system permease protein
MKYLPLILKNLLRKKTRTALTVASIVLPLLVINLMGTFLQALDRPDPGATRGMFRTVTRHKVSLGNPLPIAYFEKIRQLTGVVAATKFTWFGGRYVDQSAKNFFPRFAVEPETFLKVFDDAKILQGSNEEWLADRTGAVVGENLVKKFGWKLGDKVVLVGDIFPVTLELTIRGIYQLPDGNASSVFFNRKYIEEAFPPVAGQVGTVWVKAADGPTAERLTREIDAMFENASAPTKTESEKAFQMGFVQMLGNVKLLINGIATMIVFVIFLIAANTMSMAARERVTEIAVLRALGFGKPAILGMILAESLFLALIGGGLGILLFVLAEPALKAGLMASPMSGFAASFGLFPEVLAMGLFITVSVGVVAGVVPALQSARRPIVDGLRRVA